MKYLEEKELVWLNSLLSSYDIGDRVIKGRIEAFSCKKTASDRKLAKSLEQHYQQEISETQYSPRVLENNDTVEHKPFENPQNTKSDLSNSYTRILPSAQSIGALRDAATRKLLIDLITTMNATFPDYDFSSVQIEQFYKEKSSHVALNRINYHLAEMMDSIASKEAVEGTNVSVFADKMWKAIARIIRPEECEVYSYIPDMESDPFSDGNLWSINYFFHNKRLKKILYVTCMCKSITCDDMDDEDEMMDDVTEDTTEEDIDDTSDDYFGMSNDWEDGA
ncbi:unnamed protein product [Albugo candida]|uniref:Repressor of RNA polymerase III transcription n=1 Tax=Albugo candida TaxID=65357 RepID=A0A024GV14_9STRA|nr:unnamed protein product [Albugo candida]CCI50834.1 unnamed protein product [Albugo candida]|eukprot:CCI49676.1 unnamed protein product [Albugo candida]